MFDKISDLPLRNYDRTRYPRRMTRAVGEKAGVRIIDIKDRKDMTRYKEINDRLNEDEFENVFLSEQETIQEAREGRPGYKKKRRKDEEDPTYDFMIAGSKAVEGVEVGELQGWASYWPDTYAQKLSDMGLIPNDTRAENVLEVEYVRRINAAEKQTASGLRQVLSRLGGINLQLRLDRIIQLEHNFEAYVANKKVNGLTTEEEIDLRKQFDQILRKKYRPNFIVTAYVNPDNKKSIEVAKACGFEDKGIDQFTEGGPMRQLFVLNWDNLDRIVHEKVEDPVSALVDPISS